MSLQVNITRTLGRSFAWQNANYWQDATRRAAIIARFWDKVTRADAKACWLFCGTTNSRGYGLVSIHGRTRVRAHRFSWLLSRGEIPEGQEVCHKCDNTLCVNPDHLFLGTHQENHLDSVRKGRKRAWGLQKLNAAQVYDIRACVARGELHREVAHRYGIARNTVSQIVSRKCWAHLPEMVSQKGVA